jgi:hypothetical protein
MSSPLWLIIIFGDVYMIPRVSPGLLVVVCRSFSGNIRVDLVVRPRSWQVTQNRKQLSNRHTYYDSDG